MFIVETNAETCDGNTCQDCIDSCPVEMLDLVSWNGANGEKQISGVITDMNECIGCMACEAVCPTESITVTEY